MSILADINLVTVLIGCVFSLPILFGILWPPTANGIRRSFGSLFNSLLFLASILLAVWLTRVLLSGGENAVMSFLYGIIPALRVAVSNHDILVYAAFIAVLLMASYGVLYLLTIPVYKYIVEPLANGFSTAVEKMGGFAKRVLGGLWQLPKAMWLVLAAALLLNFYTGYNSASALSRYANDSAPYQWIQGNVIQPLLNNSVVKDFRVLLDDSFGKKAEGNQGEAARTRLIVYFNGVTLDDAVKSTAQIDAQARKTVGRETSDRRKAALLYAWIAKNIRYDYQKAELIARNSSGVASGAVVAYDTKSGVCFDYACLYVAMCRAVGLKVRFLTGLGYTGTAWGDHAWNQVYDPKAGAWINVDATFGSSGVDYFDRPNFDLDHKEAVIQREW